jgi:FMN hydrolase / 5-amino-6-(5-phospho-D-ribitylamino)uracil phosphatase
MNPSQPRSPHFQSSRLRLITLDLDDTVWPCAPVIQAAELALLEWLGTQAPRLLEVHDQGSLREHRRRLMSERPEIAHDVTQVRRLSLAELLVQQGLPLERAQSLADQALRVFLDHRNRIEPYADSAPALRRLAARFHLVSITNGNSDPELTPLRGIFRHRVNAAEAGASKPDPAVFERALALAGCTPAECLHVGDEPYLDVAAARNLGIGSVWVNRHGRPWPEELPPPLLTVPDLHRLADWLESGTGASTPTGGESYGV